MKVNENLPFTVKDSAFSQLRSAGHRGFAQQSEDLLFTRSEPYKLFKGGVGARQT